MTGAETLTGPGGPLAATETPVGGARAGAPQQAPEKPEEARTVYVIQRAIEVDYEPDEPIVAWEDVGTVSVPKRSSRKTVFETALKDVEGLWPPVTDGSQVQASVRMRAVPPEDLAVWEAVFDAPPAPPPALIVRPVPEAVD
jgi:hypothetical protein